MFVSKAFLIVAGLGAFGPGILRELGWLRDQDEFQRQAARRAGYHAYLIGGLATVLIISGLEWRGTDLEDAREWMRLIIVVFWLSWLFSSLLAYWGAQKTTSWVLMTFGSFWAVFVIASLIGESKMPENPEEFFQGLLGVLTGIAVVAPFFVLAWTARRWPRWTGVALLAVATFLFVLFFPRGNNLKWSTVLLTDTLLLVPLIASGIALLQEGISDGSNGHELMEDGVVPDVAG